MDYKNILYEVFDGIGRLTINRPKTLNALNHDTLLEINDVIENHTKDLRVLIITGSGEKAFIAGADISTMSDLTPKQARGFAEYGTNILKKFENIDTIIIAAVNGFALGGGCELAMACDLIYASEDAKFGQPEINLGIMPGFGGTQRLSRLIGKSKAKELILTGDMISANEAQTLGLVNGVFSKETLLLSVGKIATKIKNKPTFAVKAIKRAINQGYHLDLERALELEVNYFAILFDTLDQKEGVKAFLEKRKPEFKGC